MTISKFITVFLILTLNSIGKPDTLLPVLVNDTLYIEFSSSVHNLDSCYFYFQVLSACDTLTPEQAKLTDYDYYPIAPTADEYPAWITRKLMNMGRLVIVDTTWKILK